MVCFFLWQTSEQAETKKRKASVKEDGKKLKKAKTGKEKGNDLTLNAATKCVEILHIKVMRHICQEASYKCMFIM